MSKEAMKLALEELRYVLDCINKDKIPFDGDDFHETIKALEEALVKQEQGEPVAWIDIDEKGAASGLRYWSEPDNRHEVALYTTPQQRTWVGMMRGVRVEGNTVVIAVKGGNDAARELCGELINEMEMRKEKNT
jgi:hypothetical protein